MSTFLNGNNFAHIYVQLIQRCLNTPDYISSPRGQNIYELINTSIELTNPLNNAYSNYIRPLNTKYLAGELNWYLSGSNSIGDIIGYSKFWNSIKNEDGTLNSAYGYNIFYDKIHATNTSEWEWAIDALIKDKDSRQSIIRINKPYHSREGVKDFPCTLTGQFLIRDNKLNFIINMRSNDLFKGIIYDIPFFTILQQMMRLSLLEYYPDLKLGSYFHNVGSTHIYEKDEDTFKEMLKYLFLEENLPQVSLLKSAYDYFSSQEDSLVRWINENK